MKNAFAIVTLSALVSACAVVPQEQAAPQPAAWRLAFELRGGSAVLEEDQELDLAIRRWEAERRAGIAWSTDFGDCWRQIEWIAVIQQLLPVAAAVSEPRSTTVTKVSTSLKWSYLRLIIAFKGKMVWSGGSLSLLED